MCKVVNENCRELVHAPCGSHHPAADFKNNLLPLEKIIEDVDRILSSQPNPSKERPTSDSVPQPEAVLKSSPADPGSENGASAVLTNMESDESMQIDRDPINEKPEPSADVEKPETSAVPASENTGPDQPDSTTQPEKSSIDEMEVEASKDIGTPEDEQDGEGGTRGVIVLDD